MEYEHVAENGKENSKVKVLQSDKPRRPTKSPLKPVNDEYRLNKALKVNSYTVSHI